MSLGNNNRSGGAFVADAVNIRPEASFKVFQDEVYSISKRLDWAASETIDLILDPTGCNCSVLALLPIKFKAAFAGPIDIDIYTDPTFTPNTELPPNNRNLPSSIESGMIWYLNPAVSDPGTIIPNAEFRILSNGTAAVATLGGESAEDLILNLDFSKVYLIKLINIEANPAKGAFAASLFEIP